MFDEILDKISKSADGTHAGEAMYLNWYFYADYYVTPQMRVYKKNQLVCACKVGVN